MRIPVSPTTPSRRSRSRGLLLGLIASTCVALVGCGAGTGTDEAKSSEAGAGGTDGCVTDYQEGVDYFPDKSTLEYAENFTVTYHDSYQVLDVKESYQGGPEEKYVLYRCGTPAPEATGDLAGAQMIQVPIDSLFSGSTTHLPLLADLDRMDILTGVANAGYVTNADARTRIEQGKAVEYAPNQAIDTELVIAKKPDVVMTGGTDDPAYATIRNAGIPVIANAEWLETSPLGRAEWIKYMGALTGEEAKADKVFDQIVLDYDRVKQAAADSGAPVTVLPGQMYEGVWYMPGGDSYVAALIKDANGTYAWADVQQNANIQLSLEDVLAKGRDADIWLMSADVQTLSDVTADDPRYAEFAAFQSDNVWSNNAKIGPGGGNDYWERGVTRPDLVLADLVTIMHPDAQPDHELEFYRKVGR